MVREIGHQLCTRDTLSCENGVNAKGRIIKFHDVQSWRDLTTNLPYSTDVGGNCEPHRAKRLIMYSKNIGPVCTIQELNETSHGRLFEIFQKNTIHYSLSLQNAATSHWLAVLSDIFLKFLMLACSGQICLWHTALGE